MIVKFQNDFENIVDALVSSFEVSSILLVLHLQAAAHLSRSSNLQEQDDLDLYYCLYLAHSLAWTKGLEKYLYCTQKKQLFGVDIGRTAAAISISFL